MLKVKFIKEEENGPKNKYELISYIRYCRELLDMYQSTFKKIAKCVILESLKRISKCVKGLVEVTSTFFIIKTLALV